MKSSVTTALGIDVTETQISVALLRKTEEGLRVLHAAQAPVPEGVLEYGRIVDPATLLSTLKTLKDSYKARPQRVALSLPIGGTLTRVVPVDEVDPQLIARFVQDEVKQYATFSGRVTMSDFRILVPATPRAAGKLLVTAADHEGVNALVSACRNAGMQCTTVESTVTACVRAFLGAQTAGGIDWTLLALQKDGTLTLCVLRRGMLDYVRTKVIPARDGEPQRMGEWVANECNAVIRFYDIAETSVSGQWRVIVIDDTGDGISQEAQQSIEEGVSAPEVRFWTRAHWWAGLIADGDIEGGLSVAAVGSAIRLFEEGNGGPSVNLLPQEETRASLVRRNMLLAANALAALMLVVVLMGGGFSWMAGRVSRNIAEMKQTALERGDRALPVAVSALASAQQDCRRLSAELACLRDMSQSRVSVDWVRLLNDIKKAVPDVLRITELSLDDTAAVRIKGVSKSYEGVDVFVELLNRSDHIRRAALVQKNRATSEQTDVRYIVKCSLASGEMR